MAQVNFCQDVLEQMLNNKPGFESHHMALPVVVGKLFNLRVSFSLSVKGGNMTPLQGC